MTLSKLKQEGREEFEANLLDGDSVEDCGGAMISAKEALEWCQAQIEKAYSVGCEYGSGYVKALEENLIQIREKEAYLSALSDVEKEVISLAVYSGQDCGAKHQFNIVQDKQRQALKLLSLTKTE